VDLRPRSASNGMKTFLILMACLILIEAVYLKITKVSFDNYKGKVSGLYCTLSSLDNLPKDPIIFVPGIKGSTLEKGGERAWLNFSDVVFGGLDLKYSEDDGIKATGVFTGFKIAPFIAYEPYFKMTANIACAQNGYLFYYDWRDYPDTNSKKFGELVERVIKETGKKPSVIAHSMGGLVSYFDDVNEGKSTGLNKSLMSKEVIFSQPASYLLMPHKGSGKYYGKELMEAKTWSDNRFSVFRDGTADLDRFQKVLDRVAEYHNLLDTPKTLNNKFLFVVGECHSTVLTIDKDGKRAYFPGDGRVSENASYPFDILTDKKIEVFCRTHDEQMNDKDVIAKIFDFINF
jgi:hypothetical protein